MDAIMRWAIRIFKTQNCMGMGEVHSSRFFAFDGKVCLVIVEFHTVYGSVAGECTMSLWPF